jgi:catechol 2,3-dioxygenase-like lactoylglutathione lyase family enzyme
MAKVILGNHLAVFAARSQQERIRKFYCDVLGCKARVTNDEVDRFQLDDVHFIFVLAEHGCARHLPERPRAQCGRHARVRPLGRRLVRPSSSLPAPTGRSTHQATQLPQSGLVQCLMSEAGAAP